MTDFVQSWPFLFIVAVLAYSTLAVLGRISERLGEIRDDLRIIKDEASYANRDSRQSDSDCEDERTRWGVGR